MIGIKIPRYDARMKALILTLLLASTAFPATYRGESLDGKKLAATVRVNGVIEPVLVRFEGTGCELWLKGEILPMKLQSEIIDDLNAVSVYDGKREFVLKVDL